MPCRLSIDLPAPGAWNMAVDEVLLDWAAETGGCWWRFYEWSEPTLSLGYFQNYEQRGQHAASRRSVCTRRLTGGGAIVHDRELTYSLVVPAGHRLALARDRLYGLVHQALVRTLADWSIGAALHAPRGGLAARTEEPFLCFLRRAPGDVVVGPTKVAGSAQRRRRGAVIQHGSILLQQSPAAPELPGLAEIRGQTISARQLIEAWLPRLTEDLDLAWESGALSEQQRQAALQLAHDRYDSDAWVRLRGR